MKLTDFLPGLLLDCPDVPRPQAMRHIREVVQEWCRHTEVWRVDLGPMDIVAGQAAYALTYDGGGGMTATVDKVLEVEFGGFGLDKLTPQEIGRRNRAWRASSANTPSAFLSEIPSSLLFYPVPLLASTGSVADFTTDPITQAVGVNRVYCVLAPDADATDVGDVLEQWVPSIQDGIRGRLKRYLKRELRDPQLLQGFENDYRRVKGECRAKTIGNQGTTTVPVARFPGGK
jgi:hypothetical protein